MSLLRWIVTTGVVEQFRLLGRPTRRYSKKQESKLWRQKPNKEPRLKIILTQDVPNLGVKGQIVKVKHGYGRNHLLPYKTAVYATPQNIAKYDAFEVEQELRSLNLTERIVNFLEGKSLTVEHDPDDQSALFEQHISRAFQNHLDLSVPLSCIELEDPITDFDSEHSVGVRIDEETVVMVPVVIERTISSKKRQRRIDGIMELSKTVSPADTEEIQEEEKIEESSN